MDMDTIFRRLSENQADAFKPWYTLPGWKIALTLAFAAVLVRWVIR